LGIDSSVRWRLHRGGDGLAMSRTRTFGSAAFGWDDLLRAPMSLVDVYVLYFPSRFSC
jgi:hypothetical protein